MRKLPILIGVALIAGGLTGCSSPAKEGAATKAVATAPEASKSADTAPAAKGTLESVGFGREAGSDYMYVVAIVKDVPPGQTANVTFNVLDPAGNILKSETASEAVINKDARIITGTQVTVPAAKEVAKVEATLSLTGKPGKPKLEDFVLELGPVAVSDDGNHAEATVTNPQAEQITDPKASAACFNAAGNIIGGGFTFVDVVPASGKVMADPFINVTELPARCEMTIQPSNISTVG